MRRNLYYNYSFTGLLMPLLALTLSINASAQVASVVKPAENNFTYFTKQNNSGSIEKLTALNPAAFQSHTDLGSSVPTTSTWSELTAKRTLNSRTYTNGNGKTITQYGYDNINYFDKNGQLSAVDTRLKQNRNGWAVTEQENPAYLYTDGATALSLGNDQLITFNKNVQFNSSPINTTTYTVGDNGMMIKNAVANTDKTISFKRNTVETDYLINKPLTISGDLIVSEDIILPSGYTLSQNSELIDGIEAGSLIVMGPDGNQKAILKVPACYDNGKSEILGSYHIKKQDGGYRLEIDVPSAWINDPSRQYPITVDPVVTGTTVHWTGGKIASCIYPSFGSGTMTVSVPAGITITGFYIQASYYANPLKSEPLDDGLVYFGTTCGNTGFSSISAPAGNSSGIGTFPLTDFHSSLACCIQPSCNVQNINLTMYLSRLAGGTTCDSQYIYYDPANTGGSDFEAYIVGNTVELNNSQWLVSPVLLCGNDCNLTLDATVNYGVPPYTVSHPWAGASVIIGKYDTSICSSTGSAVLTLTIPNCPLTSCTTTLLSVPPPVITDACGNVVSGLTSKFINVKPVPTVTATPTSDTVCSGYPFNVVLTSCVSGTTFTWTGSDGSSGSGSPIVDSVTNNSATSKTVTYTITPSANGCTGNPVTINVTVEPIPTSTFTVDPSTVCVNTKLTVIYTGKTMSGANYAWNFGGATVLSGSGAGPYSISYSTGGSHVITLTVTTNGCASTTTSQTVTIKPAPIVIVTPSPADICIGTSAQLIASGASSYTWSPSTNLNTTVGSTVSANPSSTTVYSVTGTGVNGCVATVTDTVKVTAKPIVNVSAAPKSICSGSSTMLTATGATNYTWSPSTGLSATTGSSVTAKPSVTTVYSVIGSTLAGCDDTAKITITIIKPIVNVTPANPSLCKGTTTILTASGLVSYNWSPSTGLNTTTGDSVIANPTTTSTYIVSGKDVNGCPAADTITLKVNADPTGTVVPNPVSVCLGSGKTLITSGASSYSWSPSGSLSSSSGSSVVATPITNTTYTVIGVDVNGCKDTTKVDVTVNPLPHITATPSSVKVCSSDSIDLTAKGGTSYTWSPSLGLKSTNGSSVVADPSSSTKYLVTGTDINGCMDTASVAITIVKASVTVTPANPTICTGSSIVLSASGLSSYNWSPSTGLNKTSGDSVIANPTVNSTYIVSGKDANGCPASDTITLKVNSDPKGTVTPNPVSVCLGSSQILTTSGASTYSWSPSGSLSSSSGSSVVATPITNTTYMVIGVYSNGCKDTASVDVTVNPLPHIIATPSSATICLSDSVDLTAKGGTSYTWSPSSGLKSTSGSSTVAHPAGTTKYIVTGTDVNGCSDTASVMVNITKAIVSITPVNPAICIGGITLLHASGLLSYTWSPSSGLSATSGDSVFADPKKTTTYVVSGKDINGCFGTDTFTLKVNPNPIATVTPNPVSVCKGIGKTITTSGASFYFWFPSTGLNSTTGAAVIINPSSNITYTVIGVDTNGCKDTTKVDVTVNSLPVITATPAMAKICLFDSVDLTANGGMSYSWSPSLGLKQTNDSTVVATPSGTTRYIVTGTDTTTGCSDTASVLVTVTPEPVIKVSPSNPEICKGSDIVLLATGALTYTWSPAPGLSCTTCSNPIASPTVSSTYIVKSTNTACPGFDTIKVKVDTMPTLSVFKDTVICQNQPVELAAVTSGDVTWSPSTGLSCTTCNDPVATPNSTTTYTALAQNGACSVSDSVTISINTFTFKASPDSQHITFGNTAQLNASGADSYSWIPAGSLNDANVPDPLANPTTTTTYYVTGTDAQGCTSVDTVIVSVSDPCQLVQIPSAFTPGSNDENNYFHVLSYGGISLNDFRVFNRWGNLVYQTNNIDDRGWDGTYNGKPQPIGSYIYFAEIVCKGRVLYLKGSVTLVR